MSRGRNHGGDISCPAAATVCPPSLLSRSAPWFKELWQGWIGVILRIPGAMLTLKRIHSATSADPENRRRCLRPVQLSEERRKDRSANLMSILVVHLLLSTHLLLVMDGEDVSWEVSGYETDICVYWRHGEKKDANYQDAASLSGLDISQSIIWPEKQVLLWYWEWLLLKIMKTKRWSGSTVFPCQFSFPQNWANNQDEVFFFLNFKKQKNCPNYSRRWWNALWDT